MICNDLNYAGKGKENEKKLIAYEFYVLFNNILKWKQNLVL